MIASSEVRFRGNEFLEHAFRDVWFPGIAALILSPAERTALRDPKLLRILAIGFAVVVADLLQPIRLDRSAEAVVPAVPAAQSI